MHHLGSHYLSESIKQNQKNISDTISSSAIESIITEDIASLDTIITELLRTNPKIYSIIISNEDSKTLVKWTDKKSVTKKQLYNHAEPINYEGETFGHINIYWDSSEYLAEKEEYLNEITIFTSTMLVILALTTIFLLHILVIHPMRKIENRLLGHAKGKAENTKMYSSSREFNQLSNTISKLESLTISKEELQKEVLIRKNAQYALAKARDEALKASRTKSTFLANMSHELRTPLNAVIGYSEIIAEEAMDNKHEIYMHDANKINNAGKHLLELISNILDLSKIEAGKMELSIDKIDLLNLINSVSETIYPLITKNGNQLEIDIADNIGEICNDEIRLKQVILNLLSNASKFTKHGKISLKVRKFTQENNEWVTVSVIDNGIGISSENQEKIFHTFSQADDSTSREYGGTGLGLNISQNFCWLMGGDLQVSSELGKGAHFWIQIPSIKDSSAVKTNKAKNADLTLLTAEQVRFGLEGKNMRKKLARIFIIEQDQYQQENLSLMLKTDGLNIEVEANLETTFDKIISNPPNAIVINTKYNEDKSLKFLQLLSNNKKLEKIPVIALVKNTRSDQFINAGANYQLPYQCKITELMEKIKQSIRKH